jgi:hypothetical protein
MAEFRRRRRATDGAHFDDGLKLVMLSYASESISERHIAVGV